ncbi:transmembrane protein 223 [Piliocolobus tephrosceles]|nr:transmembrane protein 223 [Piliocolobus tephrosceles]
MLYFVFCVLDWLCPPSPEREGGPSSGGAEGGREVAPRQEVPPRKSVAMAAPWKRWPTGLLTVLRPLPMRRPLQGATLQRDVLLFEHDRGRFFTILGLFCAGQGVFWASLAVVAVSRHPVPVKPLDAEVPNRGPFDLRSALWRYGLAVGCGAIGALILGAGLLFSLRSVRSVVLRAGGQQVTLTTHAPFGLWAHFTVPLKQVSCMAHRDEVPAMLPLKVKGRRFYFLLDKAGHFPNTKLFDNTVGAYRSL